LNAADPKKIHEGHYKDSLPLEAGADLASASASAKYTALDRSAETVELTKLGLDVVDYLETQEIGLRLLQEAAEVAVVVDLELAEVERSEDAARLSEVAPLHEALEDRLAALTHDEGAGEVLEGDGRRGGGGVHLRVSG
jgi:hypothetical protein